MDFGVGLVLSQEIDPFKGEFFPLVLFHDGEASDRRNWRADSSLRRIERGAWSRLRYWCRGRHFAMVLEYEFITYPLSNVLF